MSGHTQPGVPVRFSSRGLASRLAAIEPNLKQVHDGLAHLEALLPAMRPAVGSALETVRSVRAELAGS